MNSRRRISALQITAAYRGLGSMGTALGRGGRPLAVLIHEVFVGRLASVA
jgi:hypothetical protein